MGKRVSKAARNKRESAGGIYTSLPALSLLTDVPCYGELCASAAQQASFAAAKRKFIESGILEEELYLGCVVRLDRGFPAVVSEAGLLRAEIAAHLSKATGAVGGKDSVGALERGHVAVGDWVCLRVPKEHEKGVICEILPRTNEIARWRGSTRGQRQTLAANVGLVLIAQALGAGPLDCNRIVRSAVIAADCDAAVAVVLTKADRTTTDDLNKDIERLRSILGEEVPIAVTSAGNCLGAEFVQELVPIGTVAILLGESGAGKSTLLNLMLGRDVLETGAVRERDDAGRHTTVTRRMVALPGAGIIVDEPGLRTLPLAGHERGLARVFPSIAEAAQGCRFRDCTHTHEPGCAVRRALETGAFSREAYDAWVALAAEMRTSATLLDPDIVL